MSGDEWRIDCESKKKEFLKYFEAQWNEHHHLSVKMKTGKQISDPQFNAMHVYIRHIVADLTDKGITTKQFFNDGFDLPWTEQIMKDNCWKPLQVWATKKLEKDFKDNPDLKISTKDQKRLVVNMVQEALAYKLAEYEISVGWPIKRGD